MTQSPLERCVLGPGRLQARFDDSLLPGTSADIAPLVEIAGQDRAREAIQFGLQMSAEGYNIAASGAPGSGRNTAVRTLVEPIAGRQPAPPDWVYVYNFTDPRRPRAVSLPTGAGHELQDALVHLVEACKKAIPAAFESESYQERTQAALDPFGSKREAALEKLQADAQSMGFLINATPLGLTAIPRATDGTPMSPEVFAALPDQARTLLEQRAQTVEQAIAATLRDLRRLDAEARTAVATLNQEVTRFIIGPAIEDLRHHFDGLGLTTFFDAIEADIIAHVDTYRQFGSTLGDKLPPQLLAQMMEERDQLLDRYRVNLFVSHPAGQVGSPLVDERHPSFTNLFGKIDFESRQGGMVTDFLHIRPGAVHMANGGYLLLQAADLLADARSWFKLKQALKTREARVEDWSEGFIAVPIVSLAPEGIPLHLKVILIGEPMLFALLDGLDPDFRMLFKVRAEFEPDLAAEPDTIQSYAGFAHRMAETCDLLPFSRDGLLGLLAEGSRLAGRQDRVTARLGAVGDLCQEADRFAREAGASTVGRKHVADAARARDRRSGLIADRIRDMIAEGQLHIETTGNVVGQLNGLAVFSTGSREFGAPVRITCRTSAGRTGIVAIERETERSGAIHTKGVLVLTGYLMGTFGREFPLAFNASLTFEQSYDEVEGDSASSAELCALLAALAAAPLRQDIAVTGSVDQFGNVQAVGGVTAKIEGFFDVCARLGLSGSQGVILPASNVVNLTLRDDIVQAVVEGRFHIWAVSRIEDTIEILTGVEAGARSPAGEWPVNSIFGRVHAALRSMARAASPVTSD